MSNGSIRDDFKSQEVLPLSKIKKGTTKEKQNPLANHPLNQKVKKFYPVPDFIPGKRSKEVT